MNRIFISYSRRDVEMVDRIVGKMDNAGINIWIDREAIKAGNLWRTQIVEAIDTCDAFVLILSSNSAASDNVRKEIDLAQDSGRKIFIVRLDQVKIPANIRYQLAGLQHVDLHMLGFDEAVNQLIETMKEQSNPVDEPLTRQAELVFTGRELAQFGPIQQEQTLDLISALTGTPQSQLEITKATGSAHVFVNMPASAAFKLKTRALNRDDRLMQFGIKSLRLEGDKKYVNASLGIFTTNATMGILQLFWMSLPPLLPSILGITGGKIILFTSTIAVTTVVSIFVSDAVNAVSNSTQTPDPRNDYPVTETMEGTPFSTPAQADPQGLTYTSVPPMNPTHTDLPYAASTPGLTRTPIPIPSRTPAPNIVSTLSPPRISTSTPAQTINSTTPPNTLIPMAQIVNVECGTGLALNVHIRISNEAGISSYSVWSTWGGGGQIDRTFSAPLPKAIDEVVVHEHATPDNVDRQHQVGLRVTTPDGAQPIFTYAMEPDGRCPDHYQLPSHTSTPSPVPMPTAQILSVECGTGLTLSVRIRIISDAGISSYSVWSTWGGGGQIDQTFSSPLPTVIDQIVEHTHDNSDPFDRQHEVGLMVTTPDNPEPIFTYASEPGGRCPDHYQSPPPTPTDTPLPPSPSLQVTDVFLQADPIDYVGTCPVRITFSGIVSVDGSGTVSYQFLRSDGALQPVQTLTFDGPGSQNVSDTWDLGETGSAYSGWESIQILDPQSFTSNQAAFTIQCQ